MMPGKIYRRPQELIDPRSGATVGVDNRNYRIHRGEVFYVVGVETKQNAEQIIFAATAPPNGHKIDMTFGLSGTSGVKIELFEGGSGVVGGTLVAPFNADRNSDNTSLSTTVKDPVSIAVLGSLIFIESAGANQRVGKIDPKDEIVLRNDTLYVYRITSLGANNIISYAGIWEEYEDWINEEDE